MSISSVSAPASYYPASAPKQAAPPPPSKVDADGDHDGDTKKSDKLLNIKA